jgi:branched-chain amino acid transport system permease protein
MMGNNVFTQANNALKKAFLSRFTLYVILLLAVVWPLVINNSYYWHVAATMIIGAIAALGFNLYFGYMGQVNLGPVAWFGIGAYSAALMQMKLGVPWPIASLIIAPLTAALITYLLSFPLLRLRGHGLALGTFGFAWMVYLIIDRWRAFTGGGDGMAVDVPKMFGQNLRMVPGIYLLSLVCLVIVFYILQKLISSKHGRAIKSISTDDIGAAAMGINVTRYKRYTFVLSSAVTGLAGGLLAQEAGWLGSDYANVPFNMLFILMVFAGGRASNSGALVGGLLLSVLPVFLIDFAEYAVVIYSVTILLIMRFVPTGFVGVIKSWLGLRVP